MSPISSYNKLCGNQRLDGLFSEVVPPILESSWYVKAIRLNSHTCIVLVHWNRSCGANQGIHLFHEEPPALVTLEGLQFLYLSELDFSVFVCSVLA